MTEWIRITECGNIPPREGRTTTIGGRVIAIFNLGPETGLGAGPSTQLGAGPSAGLGTGPSTGLGTGPSTGLGTGPSTGLGAGPSTQLGAGPSAGLGTGDRFLALDNRCPHRGGPLGDGIIAGDSVVCPLHAWKISLETGEVQRPAGTSTCVQTYETRVADGVILIALPSNDAEVTNDEGQAA